VARRRLTGVAVGIPIASASLSWEYVEDIGVSGSGAGCLMLPGRKLPRVRQVTDPIVLGVHPSPPSRPGSCGPDGRPLAEKVPVYVPRDLDTELGRRLGESCFVVIVGDSSAGKTRAAFEAMTNLKDHVLIVPQDHVAVAAAIEKALAIRRCVLWLDDLEKYLAADGLTRTAVASILSSSRSHRVIIATLRSAEESRLVGEGTIEEVGWGSRRNMREVLELAWRVPLARMLTPAEISRAQERSWDPRIADALTQRDSYGLAEYLAAGPELLRDWEDAWGPNTDPQRPSHPRAAALIAAAIDIRRGGYTSPLPRGLLEQVHGNYLQERGGLRLRPEPMPQAWTWVTMPRRATTALLQMLDDDHVQVFDYLLDSVQLRSTAGDHAPDEVLAAALAKCSPADAENIASTAYDHSRYELAESAITQASRALEAELGPEHPRTLGIRLFRAGVVRELDRPAEALIESEAVADIAARTLGPRNPVTLRSRTSRAFAMMRLGRCAEADAELLAVQKVSIEALGPYHDVTLTCHHLRAIALSSLARIAEAETENRFVLDTWTRQFGPEDVRTLLSRGNLATVLYSAGRFEEAERESRMVAEIRARILGPEHLDTLWSRAFLSDMLRELGRAAEAESEYRAIIETAARVYGPDHRRVLNSRTGHAFAMIRLGETKEAEEELRAVQLTSMRTVGPDSYLTVRCRHLLAIALHRQGRLAEAESENRLVLDIWTRKYGPEDTDTLYSRGNLASILYDTGRVKDALSEALVVLEIRTRLYGPDHPDTIHIRSLIAKMRMAGEDE
jgi:tetratricopeptide (TPR) repeat protein